ncbi:MAG: FKBP-type peptidyl-prolyl cis-trans isomerase [Polyangiaceae bacterium]|nr:FKBP-type peptidyl-prolyl cis-trans isomerase [Polyangiaceae bacterium]
MASVLACSRRVPEPEAEAWRSAPAEPTVKVPEVTELIKEDQSPGSGEAAETGDQIKVHYTGRLLTGQKFDSSRDRNEPFEFTLGRGEVIKGWDEGVVGMKAGGKRKLTIPSDLAYGAVGSPPKIPPNAPLEFEIELIEIVK